jgi:hypothetical protein
MQGRIMILRRHGNGSFYFGKCVARNVVIAGKYKHKQFRTHSCREKVGGYKIFRSRPEGASPTPSRERSCSSITGLIGFDYVETNSAGC